MSCIGAITRSKLRSSSKIRDVRLTARAREAPRPSPSTRWPPPGPRPRRPSRRRARAGRGAGTRGRSRQPSSSIGPSDAAASSSQSVEVGGVAAALDVLPEPAAALIPSSPWPGRVGEQRCAARAGPCRWAGRRGARRRDRPRDRGAASISGATSIASAGDAGVLEAHAISGARVPAQIDPADVAGEQLEVGVPDPGDVAAVGDAVVERDPEVQLGSPFALASSSSVRSTSLAPAGFLISRIDSRLPATSIGLHPAEDRPHLLQARAASGSAMPSRCAAASGRQRVVDVVEAGEREAQLDLAVGCTHLRPRAAHAARARSWSRRRPVPGDRRRSWDSGSGRGARRRPARTRTARRSAGSAWRRRRAGAPAAPGSGPRSRSR